MRSDVNRYLTEGESGLDQLFLEYKGSLSQSFHLRTYAGILEGMYAGVGSEVLYEPFARRWAVGASINALKQRGFKKDLELLDYETVTGFLQFYYASPFYNVDLICPRRKVSCEDKGATFEESDEPLIMAAIGGFFTRTDVPAELFGEGSFDKVYFSDYPSTVCSPATQKMLCFNYEAT